MNRFAIFAFAVVISSAAVADEIPLKDIWSNGMPGTRAIKELQAQSNLSSGPLGNAIEHRLAQSHEYWGSKKVGPGLAVSGTGLDALQWVVHALQVNNPERSDALPPGDVSLFFFTRRSGFYCRVEKVSREQNTITITYRFYWHMTKDISVHFALIPLGKLPAGKYEVKEVQLPMRSNDPNVPTPEPDSTLDAERISEIVSQPFSFEVK